MNQIACLAGVSGDIVAIQSAIELLSKLDPNAYYEDHWVGNDKYDLNVFSDENDECRFSVYSVSDGNTDTSRPVAEGILKNEDGTKWGREEAMQTRGAMAEMASQIIFMVEKMQDIALLMEAQMDCSKHSPWITASERSLAREAVRSMVNYASEGFGKFLRLKSSLSDRAVKTVDNK